jgi:hypothetical protein
MAMQVIQLPIKRNKPAVINVGDSGSTLLKVMKKLDIVKNLPNV